MIKLSSNLVSRRNLETSTVFVGSHGGCNSKNAIGSHSGCNSKNAVKQSEKKRFKPDFIANQLHI